MLRAALNLNRNLSCCLLVGGLLLLLGCGGGTFRTLPVEGSVTVGGQPMDRALVTFVPMEGQPAPASGITNAAGKFQLKTIEGPRDHVGAIPGKYKVLITKPSPAALQLEEAQELGIVPTTAANPTWLIPAKYSQVDTSDLIATVEAGMKPLQFELPNP